MKIGILIGMGIIIGFFIGATMPNLSLMSDQQSLLSHGQVRLNEGVFTNPLLECEIANGIINSTKVNFGKELNVYAQSIEEASSGIDTTAIYFRDLNNGPTFGFSENEPYIPASLLKLPVLMAFYKKAESDSNILEKEITVTEDILNVDIPQQIPPQEKIKIGSTYTVENLLTRMIVYSDNQSLISLFSAIPQNELMHLYTLLGINPDVVSNPTASLTVKQYSAFFRILFNSSFLSQKNSENILSQLEQSSFDDGLRAGVPNEISIAHKFGERLFDGKQQLHDCGIIYYPKHPYLLCVMTRGNDIESLRDAIAKISRFVYKKIDQQY